MGEPPRLSQILLPREKAIIYFVTLCVQKRCGVLITDKVFEAIKAAIIELKRWRVLSGVVMPDHLHVVITPSEDCGLSVGDFTNGFKRLLRKSLAAQSWEWQRGGWDRLLRSDESLQAKWIYREQNPVRAGRVRRVEDWPYYLGSLVEDGKLAASPTERARLE
jgi:REP element-mobilizing transposase RayT